MHQGDGGKDFKLYVTHHDEGGGDVYRCETALGDQIAWGTLIRVLAAAEDRLKKEKHTCSDSCSDWRPISS